MTTMAMRLTCSLGSCVDFLAEESANVLCDRRLKSRDDHLAIASFHSDDGSSSTEPSNSTEWIERDALSDLWEGIGLEEKEQFLSDMAAESRDEENGDDSNNNSSLLTYESFPSQPTDRSEQWSLMSASLAPLLQRRQHKKNKNRLNGRSEEGRVMSTSQKQLEYSQWREKYKTRSEGRPQEESLPSTSHEPQVQSRRHNKNKKEKKKRHNTMSEDELSDVFDQLEVDQPDSNSRHDNDDVLERVPIVPNSILKKPIAIIRQQYHDPRRCLQ